MLPRFQVDSQLGFTTLRYPPQLYRFALHGMCRQKYTPAADWSYNAAGATALGATWMYATLLAVSLFAAEPAAASPQTDVAVVAPREFLPALRPLIEHRQDQGHQFTFIANTLTAEEIRTSIRTLAAGGKLKYVLLVGDADPAAAKSAAIQARSVPTHLQPAVVNVKWGSEPEIATDNWYADLDDDQIPELAVGRLPADSPADVSRMVAKILAYEHNADFGAWRQRVNFIAGVGGFSPLIDTVLETATSKFLTAGIPPAYDTRMTYGSWRSPYCPDPRLFHDVTLQRHNEGCLFWVYIGHGYSTGLDRVVVPGERFHILDASNCSKLQAQSGQPIAIALACYTAAFDQPQDCLGEEMLKAEGGPVAFYGGTRVTMPYAMAVMGTNLMEEYFKNRRPTIGEAILAAKRRTMEPVDENDPLKSKNRLLLDGIASVISPSRELMDAERCEHLALFNLMGDPMTRLTYPQEVRLDVPRDAQPGQRLQITGSTELAGRGILELVGRRDRLKFVPPIRDRFDPADKFLESFQPVYEQANDRTWGQWQVDLPAGDFTTEVIVPEASRGPCHVRLLVAGDKAHALGSTNIYIRPLPEERSARRDDAP